METPIVGAIITASTAVSVFIGNIIFKRWHARRERQIETGKALIKSFDVTKTSIIDYNGYFNHLMNVLRNESEKQRIAAHELRRHLGYVKRCRFNKAWKKYHRDKAENLKLIHYETKDIQRILLSRIDEILKFTR